MTLIVRKDMYDTADRDLGKKFSYCYNNKKTDSQEGKRRINEQHAMKKNEKEKKQLNRDTTTGQL
jgi:hypothetical protein